MSQKKRQAIAQFGDEKWIAGLVREYVKLAKLNGDDNATAINRRPPDRTRFQRGKLHPHHRHFISSSREL